MEDWESMGDNPLKPLMGRFNTQSVPKHTVDFRKWRLDGTHHEGNQHDCRSCD